MRDNTQLDLDEYGLEPGEQPGAWSLEPGELDEESLSKAVGKTKKNRKHMKPLKETKKEHMSKKLVVVKSKRMCKSNIVRCREYRRNKNFKLSKDQEELKQLEARNQSLRQEEEVIMDKLAKLQDAYLKLIQQGKLKFV